MRSLHTQLFPVAAIFISAIFLSAPVHAQAVKWIANTQGDWNAGANWSTLAPPAVDDDVSFDGNHTGDALISANFNAFNIVNSITIQAGYTGTIGFASGAGLQITNSFSIAGGTFDASQATAPILFFPLFTQTGGTFTAPPPGTLLAVRGNWSHTGGTFNHNAGVVEFRGDGQYIIDTGAAHFFNFRLTTANSGTVTLLNTDFFADGSFELLAPNLSTTFNANGRSMTIGGMLTMAGGTLSCMSGTHTFNGGMTIGGNTYQNTRVDGTLQLGVSTINVTDVTILKAPANNFGHGALAGIGNINVSGNWLRQGGTNGGNNGAASVNFTQSFRTQTLDNGSAPSDITKITHSGAGTLAIINNPLRVSTFLNTAGMVAIYAPATVEFSGNLVLQQPPDGVCIVDVNDSVATVGQISMTGGILRTGAAGSIQSKGSVTGALGTGDVQPVIQGNYQLSGNFIQPITVAANAELRMEANIAPFQNSISGIKKLGAGTLKLLGNNSYVDTTTVSSGTLTVNGNNGPSNFVVNSGATLRGTGSIAALTVDSGGIVRPGDTSPGTLTAAGNVTFSNGSIFTPDIAGSAPGQFGQLKINGLVLLNTPMLLGTTTGLSAPVGTSFMLIDNDQADAVTGTFANAAEGSPFTLAGRKFSPSYVAGTGNDFVITLQDSPPVIDTNAQAQPSGGTFNQAITLSALAHDPDGQPVTYSWNFGDNTPAGSGASIQHQYASSGTYSITLTVSDGTLATITTFNLTLTNSDPVFDTLPTAQPNPARFTQTIAFTVAAHDPDGLPVTYTWDFRDNIPLESGASVNHSFAEAGIYTVMLAVSDGVRTTTKLFNVTLTDSPPVIDNLPSFQPNPASVSQTIAFSAAAHDPDGLPLNYSWDFGDNTPAGAGASVQHSYAAAGTYAVTLTVSDGKKITVAGLNITLNGSPPVFDSTPTALPNPAGIAQTVTFAAPAHGFGAALLTTWNFGDGTTAEGSSITHTYTLAGAYPVIVALSDGANTAAQSLIVNVLPTRIGWGPDKDGDGFSDATEQATGSDAADPNSNILGKPIDPAGIATLTVAKAQIKLNFAKNNKDSIVVSGALFSLKELTLPNTLVLIDIGGVSKALTLNAKGAAKQGSDSFKLTIKKGPSAKFTASFKNGSFSPILNASSNLSNADIFAAVRTVVISVALSNTVEQMAQPVIYKAKKGRSGTAAN